MLNQKKGQLKIQEMIFMLLGVFLFFSLVGLFAMTMLSSNITKSANQAESDKVIMSLTSIANSPELNCVDSRADCIDGDKLIGFINNSNYKNFFPFNSLRVLKESGFGKNENQLTECSLSNYPNCDIFVVYSPNKNEKTVSTYSALCRKEVIGSNVYDKCEIAEIIAGIEVKT